MAEIIIEWINKDVVVTNNDKHIFKECYLNTF